MKIGLVGTFDVENFGDCLFPELYASLLRRKWPDAQFTLFSPTAHAARMLSFDKVNSLPDRLGDGDVFKQDLLILVGGETLGFGHSSGTYNFHADTLSHYLRLWLAPLWAGLDVSAGPKFSALCVGALKMPPEINGSIAEALAGAAHVTFRDSYSQSWISAPGIEFERAVDPMFLMSHICDEAAWGDLAAQAVPKELRETGYLAAQITYGYGKNDLEAWTDTIAKIARERDLSVALLPICHFLEDEYLLSIAAPMLASKGVRAEVIGGSRNVKSIASVISRSRGYVGSSLHGAVAAVSFAVPLASLGKSMDGKHNGTLQSVGYEGVATDKISDLPDCFARSERHDLGAVRAEAEARAEKGLAEFIAAMEAPGPSADTIDTARSAALRLVKAERDAAKSSVKSQIKRRMLRILRSTPALNAAYQKMRIRQRIGGAVHPKA